MSLQLDEHRLYPSDQPHVEAFDAASRAALRPGDVVGFEAGVVTRHSATPDSGA